jgi:tetratricopeptide (TPR) repeat protein
MGTLIAVGLTALLLALWLGTMGMLVAPTWLVGPLRRVLYRLQRSRAAGAFSSAWSRLRRAAARVAPPTGRGPASLDSLTPDDMRLRARKAIDTLVALEAWPIQGYPIEPMRRDMAKRFGRTVEEALLLPPEQLDSIETLALAIVLTLIGRAAEALPLFDATLAGNPDDPGLRHNRGIALLAAGRFAEAVPDLTFGLGSTTPTLADVWALADAYWGAGRLAEAREQYQLAIRLKPGSPALELGLAQVLSEMGESQAALAITADLPRAYRMHGAVRAFRSNVYGRAGDSEAALREASAALARDPTDVAALWNRAWYLRQVSRFDEALKDAQAILAIRPDHARASGLASILLESLGRRDEAVERARKAASVGSTDAWAQSAAAGILGRTGFLEEGLACAEKAVELAGDDRSQRSVKIQAMSTRLWLLRHLGQSEIAMTAALEVVRLDPRNAYAHYSLAVLHRDGADMAAALSEADEACRLDPVDGDLFEVRASVLLRLGRDEDARRDVDRALELDPDSEWATITRMQLQARDGETEVAIRALASMAAGGAGDDVTADAARSVLSECERQAVSAQALDLLQSIQFKDTDALLQRAMLLAHAMRAEPALADLRLAGWPDPAMSLERQLAAGIALGRIGYVSEATEIARGILTMDLPPNDEYNAACLFAVCGDGREAMRLLASCIGSDPSLARTAADDPDLASLRADRRTSARLARLFAGR